jgi:hypothetical protein
LTASETRPLKSEGTVEFGLFELFIDLLWWIRR